MSSDAVSPFGLGEGNELSRTNSIGNANDLADNVGKVISNEIRPEFDNL